MTGESRDHGGEAGEAPRALTARQCPALTPPSPHSDAEVLYDLPALYDEWDGMAAQDALLATVLAS